MIPTFVAALIAVASLTTAAAAVNPTPPPATTASTHEINLNQAHFAQAPAWLAGSRMQRVIDSIESKLDWDVRRIQVQWHGNQAEFRALHGFDDSVLAFTSGADASVHLGPRVTAENFDGVFGHELVHVILRQKYKGSVPRWLEEGLANFIAKFSRVDYVWLASQPTRDVYTLAHPFAPTAPSAGQSGGARYHYQASQALMEMIASHCDPQDLLQLSVGKKLETYLSNTCGVTDINAEFQTWIKRKSRSAPARP